MRGITRYILRQLLVATAFVTITLSCAIWLTQSLRFVELIINHGLSLATFLYLATLLLPTFLAVILPIAAFSAVVFTYNKLTMDRELVVLRAAGVSQVALAAPALTLGIIVTLAGYGLNLYFLPASYRQFKETEFSIRTDYTAILLREGMFNNLADGITVYVRERQGNGELLGILVHDSREPERPVTMMAERGALVMTDEGPRVVMVNGNRQQVEADDGRLSLLYFDRYSFDLGEFKESIETRWREPRERFLDELLHPGTGPGDRYYANELKAEGHQRIVSPLFALGFVLIALALLLRGDFDRRGQALRILIAIGLVVVVQTAGLGFHNLAAKTPVAVPLMYLNAVVPIIAGFYFLVRPQRRRRPGFDTGKLSRTG